MFHCSWTLKYWILLFMKWYNKNVFLMVKETVENSVFWYKERESWCGWKWSLMYTRQVILRDGYVFDENANWDNCKIKVLMIHFRKWWLDIRLFWSENKTFLYRIEFQIWPEILILSLSHEKDVYWKGLEHLLRYI